MRNSRESKKQQWGISQSDVLNYTTLFFKQVFLQQDKICLGFPSILWFCLCSTAGAMRVASPIFSLREFPSLWGSSTAGELAAAFPVSTAALTPPVLDWMLQGIVGNCGPERWGGSIFRRKQNRSISKDERMKRPGSRSLEEKIHSIFRSLDDKNKVQKPHSCN